MGSITSLTRLCAAAGLLLSLALPASAREGWRDWCWIGNQKVTTSGLTSSSLVQASYPQCTVTIFVHGGGLATIFADNNGTPLGNPFTSQTDGQFIWYANDGRYDETITGAGLPQPVTMSDILLCDPFSAGAVCAGGGGVGGAHNLLSTTHLDTIPFSPPVRGDVITAQNATSPGGTTPSWARLALGTNGQVLQSNGTDAVWATLAGASLCTASAAGTWDVNPQTCAGEKVILGRAGNPTVTNLTLTPASDQTGQNLYAGTPSASFPATGPAQSDLTFAFHSIAALNTLSLGAPGPWAYALTVVHQDNTGGSLMQGMQVDAIAHAGSWSTIHGADITCFIESTASTTLSCDGSVGEATDDTGASASVQSLVGVLGGAFNIANHATVVTDFAAEAPSCGSSTQCYAFLFPDQGAVKAFIDKNGNIQGVTVGTAVQTALPACVEGQLVAIGNSTTNVWGATITTGGANHVLGYCDGSQWTVAAK